MVSALAGPVQCAPCAVQGGDSLVRKNDDLLLRRDDGADRTFPIIAPRCLGVGREFRAGRHAHAAVLVRLGPGVFSDDQRQFPGRGPPAAVPGLNPQQPRSRLTGNSADYPLPVHAQTRRRPVADQAVFRLPRAVDAGKRRVIGNAGFAFGKRRRFNGERAANADRNLRCGFISPALPPDAQFPGPVRRRASRADTDADDPVRRSLAGFQRRVQWRSRLGFRLEVHRIGIA